MTPTFVPKRPERAYSIGLRLALAALVIGAGLVLLRGTTDLVSVLLLLGPAGMVAATAWGLARTASRRHERSDTPGSPSHLPGTDGDRGEDMPETKAQAFDPMSPTASFEGTAPDEAHQTQFLAFASHELRTPLTAILGYASLLLEDAQDRRDPDAAADLEKISQSGRRLLDLINDLVALSQPEAPEIETPRGIATLDQLVEEALVAARVDEGHKQVRVAKDCADRLLTLDQRDRTVRALANLLRVAVQRSRDVITVCVREDQTGAYNAIYISCPGWSDDEARLKALFEGPRGAPDRKGEEKNWIELAVAQNRARSVGGKCEAYTDGVGDIVLSLQLPTGPMAESDEGQVEGNVLAQIDAARASNAARIVLAIDDDPAAIDLVRRWLEKRDCHVLEASDGASGLELAIAAKPDLVLLDAFMPGRNGYDVLEEIRRTPAIEDLPVVLITVDDDRSRGLTAGASDYIRKPVSEAQLGAVVQTYADAATGRILVIDDDEDAAQIMCRHLGRTGFETLRASDGKEGFDLARKERPSAILLDVRMPNHDGFDFIERIAGDPELNGIPVIVLSGYDLTLPQHHLLSQAGHRFFSKGVVAPREIADTLRELVA